MVDPLREGGWVKPPEPVTKINLFHQKKNVKKKTPETYEPLGSREGGGNLKLSGSTTKKPA